jgi:hypothetical protein
VGNDWEALGKRVPGFQRSGIDGFRDVPHSRKKLLEVGAIVKFLMDFPKEEMTFSKLPEPRWGVATEFVHDKTDRGNQGQAVELIKGSGAEGPHDPDDCLVLGLLEGFKEAFLLVSMIPNGSAIGEDGSDDCIKDEASIAEVEAAGAVCDHLKSPGDRFGLEGHTVHVNRPVKCGSEEEAKVAPLVLRSDACDCAVCVPDRDRRYRVARPAFGKDTAFELVPPVQRESNGKKSILHFNHQSSSLSSGGVGVNSLCNCNTIIHVVLEFQSRVRTGMDEAWCRRTRVHTETRGRLTEQPIPSLVVKHWLKRPKCGCKPLNGVKAVPVTKLI